ncbi:MAG: hypothetical protein CM1200mP30_08770 [Pseudomonadota bacterium]|nr:MAG: hypothetical protein CM1200mP30_08770 [Pseudomonadota bacterium]
MRNKVDRLGSKAREAAGELSAHAIDSVQGLAEIVAYQQGSNRGRSFEELTARAHLPQVAFLQRTDLQSNMLEV